MIPVSALTTLMQSDPVLRQFYDMFLCPYAKYCVLQSGYMNNGNYELSFHILDDIFFCRDSRCGKQ